MLSFKTAFALLCVLERFSILILFKDVNAVSESEKNAEREREHQQTLTENEELKRENLVYNKKGIKESDIENMKELVFQNNNCRFFL